MADSTAGRLRRFWLNVHLWLGVGLALLLVPIAVSGAILVFHDDIEARLNPGRYAVTGAASQPASAYLAMASAALGAGQAPVVVRYPQEDGRPVVVVARSAEPPRLLNVYLDPATAKVLDVVDARASFFGVLHRFHENLTIPDYSGRAIVGWLGVGMLISSLTGIYLWWPRNGTFWRGLRWRRSALTTANLHHLLGFWISIPLAVVSLTGVYLGFPQQGRELLSAVAPISAPVRPSAGPMARQTALTPDEVLALAGASQPGARLATLFPPSAARGGEAPVWRVQLRETGTNALVTLAINDRDRAIVVQRTQSGDRVAQWIRWIHEGSHSGPVWAAIVFLCGVFPPVFAVTGVIMWLTRRRSRNAAEQARGEAVRQLRPAE